MACEAMHSWTLCGLLRAYIDLAIAYLFLCLSSLAFFLSTFLAFFGLNLPCTCPHLNPNPFCLQRVLLLDCPADRLSRVQLSIRTKFPFRSIWAVPGNDAGQLDMSPLRGRSGGVGGGGEGSGGGAVGENEAIVDGKEKGMDDIAVIQRKRIIAIRQRRRRRHHHTRGNLLARFRSATSSDLVERVRSDTRVFVPGSPSSVDRISHDMASDNSMPVTLNEDQRSNVGSAIVFEGQKRDVIRVLEDALEEEQAVLATLSYELEKERIAAATAADEAMAMISRLQEEKASIEVEARQYQRILEEKSAYDDGEMGILKEIIVRREREKHFLENQVQAYRHLLLDNEQLKDEEAYAKIDAQARNFFVADDSNDDPMWLLQQFSQAVDNARTAPYEDDFSASESLVKDECTKALEGDHNSLIPRDLDDKFIGVDGDLVHDKAELGQDIQEKGMITMNKIQISQQNELQGPEANLHTHSSVDHAFEDHDNSMIFAKKLGKIHHSHSYSDMAPGTVKQNDEAEISSMFSYNGVKTESDMDVNIHDVHVIEDKFDVHDAKQSVNGGLDLSPP